MTLTADRTAVAVTRTPRELISPELFDRLAGYVARHQEVTLSYAERVIEQTLIWLKACAENPDERLAMDETVDPGWHAFILHSQDYTDFCDRMLGGYLHHVPPAAGGQVEDDAVARTLPALRSTGYPVDEQFWIGAKPCCPPEPCIRGAAAGKCNSGTGAPPPAVSQEARA